MCAMLPGPGGIVDATINANNAINKEYRELLHPPGSVAIRWKSGRL